MIAKALIDYSSPAHDVCCIAVDEQVERLAQRISRVAPKTFPCDGVETYRLAIRQLQCDHHHVPYGKILLRWMKTKYLSLFIIDI